MIWNDGDGDQPESDSDDEKTSAVKVELNKV